MGKKSKFFKKTAGLMAFLFILTFSMPAQAFYVEMPKNFTQNWQSLIAGKKAEDAQKVLGVKVLGEAEINPTLGTCRVNGVDVPGPCDQSNTNSGGNLGNTAPQSQPFADLCSNNTQVSCVSDEGKITAPKVGLNNQPACPDNLSLKCMPAGGQNNQSGQNGQGQGGQNNQGSNQMNQGGQGQGDQNQQKNQERMMQDVKRNIKQMESNLKRLETAFKNAGAKGTAIPAEVKDKLTEARSTLEAMKAAETPEAMQEIDMGALNETMQSLEQSRQDIVDSAQRMDGIKRGIKGMESGLKSFESQIARLVKQKIVIPAETTDSLNKVKTIVAAVKNAKTLDEMEAAGVEDLQEVMQNLNDSRGQLEMLARWPQTLKQMDKQLTMLNSQLKKNKTIVDRLAKQNIDLAANYTGFAEAIQKLKAVRDDAVQKIKDNDSQAAFDAVQDDFFGQMDDVMQNVNVIQTMSNLGRFNSDFKRSISQAQSQIKKLKAKKLDSKEAEMILNDLNEKGKEISVMLKVKPIDAEAVTAALEEMQILNQDFSDKIAELTGVEEVMPWEQGPQQFQQPQMPDNWQQLMPQQPQNNQEPMAPVIQQ